MLTNRICDATQIGEEEVAKQLSRRPRLFKHEEDLIRPTSQKIIHQRHTHISPTTAHLTQRQKYH